MELLWAGAIALSVYAFGTHPDIRNANIRNGINRRRDERRPVTQEFGKKQKVLIDDRYEAIVVAHFYDPDRVKVQYTSSKPKWFFNKYIFHCDDYSIKPLEIVQEDVRVERNDRVNADPSRLRSGSGMITWSKFETHICKHGSWIVGSPSLAHMEQVNEK